MRKEYKDVGGGILGLGNLRMTGRGAIGISMRRAIYD